MLGKQECVEGVADKTENHGHTVTNLVDNQAENDYTDGKGPNSSTEEFLPLNLVQAKCARPKRLCVYKECSCDEGKGSCDKGDETPPKQFHIRS